MLFMRCLTVIIVFFGLYCSFELQGMLHKSHSCHELSVVSRHRQKIAEFKKKLGHLTILPREHFVPTRLHRAAFKGNLTAVRRLIVDEHFPVDVQDGRGITPLHVAAQYGHVHIVQFLVDEMHANYKIVDKIGSTALHFAVNKDQRDVVRFLIKKPDIVDIQAYDGSTALYNACDNNLKEMVGILITEGHADVDKCYNGGFTPLHRACDIGYTEIVRFLIEVGHACVNAKTDGGVTPLHFAVNKGHLAIVQILLQAGANPEIKDRDNVTAYDVASNALKKLRNERTAATIRLRSALTGIISLLNKYRERYKIYLRIAKNLESHLLGKIGHLISLPPQSDYSEVHNPIFLAIKNFPISQMDMYDFEHTVMYIIWDKNLRERFSESSHEQIYRELAEFVHEFIQQKAIIDLLKALGLQGTASTLIVPPASSSSQSTSVAEAAPSACFMNMLCCKTGSSIDQLFDLTLAYW